MFNAPCEAFSDVSCRSQPNARCIALLSPIGQDVVQTAALVQVAHLVGQHRSLSLVIVLRTGARDLSRCKIQLTVTKLDDRPQPEVITALRKVKRKLRLLQQLSG